MPSPWRDCVRAWGQPAREKRTTLPPPFSPPVEMLRRSIRSQRIANAPRSAWAVRDLHASQTLVPGQASKSYQRSTVMSEMPGKAQNPGPPIGDPPKTDKPIKANRRMRDPFTDQATHPAGEGQVPTVRSTTITTKLMRRPCQWRRVLACSPFFGPPQKGDCLEHSNASIRMSAFVRC